MSIELSWLPECPDWPQRFEALPAAVDQAAQWAEIVLLANAKLDFVQTTRLDRSAQRLLNHESMATQGVTPLRLALLGSSTLKHLVPAVRVAAYRRKLWLDVFEGDYGMYLQEFLNPNSALHTFKPNFVVIALDAHHIANGDRVNIAELLSNLRHCWSIAREEFGCTVIQQTGLPVFPLLMGSNEHRLAESSPRTHPPLQYRTTAGCRRGRRSFACDRRPRGSRRN